MENNNVNDNLDNINGTSNASVAGMANQGVYTGTGMENGANMQSASVPTQVPVNVAQTTPVGTPVTGQGYYQYENRYNAFASRPYNNTTYGTPGYGQAPQMNMGQPIQQPIEKKKKEKKEKKEGNKNSFGRKVLAAAILGLTFGLCAGGVMFFFVRFANPQKEENITQQQSSVISDDKGNDTKVDEVKTTQLVNSTTVVTDVTEVVETVMPSVVSITNTFTITESYWGQNYSREEQGSGSGIIVGENESELLIVTNYHVVEGADSLKVQFINDDVADALLKGADSHMDLAVIAVKLENLSPETKAAISIAVLGDSSALTVGEPAIAIGNALGYGQSVTTGVISALDRQIAMEDGSSMSGKLIQTDAAINPGNSGGALLNVNGEVIGINSNKIGGSIIEGMGYAIPISSAVPIIEELMNQETKDKVAEENKGSLGITGLNVTSDVAMLYGMPEGVFITNVYEGMAAHKAGLVKSDVITGFEGRTVGTMEDLQGYLEYYEAGEEVNIVYMHNNDGVYEEREITVKLGKQQDFPKDRSY